MLEVVFSLDYEIYGNGEGSLRELVLEPAERLKELFVRRTSPFVVFAEVAELEMIENSRADQSVGLIISQLRQFLDQGFEIGLHIHPWWYNARYENGAWSLDYNEYNLCDLPKSRIVQVVNRAIAYLQKILNDGGFTPTSFRAGHLLFQPSRVLAQVLAEKGVKVDSSLYKGGLWHKYDLDYRPAIKNGHFWRFSDDINSPDAQGVMLELPICTQMVPFWKTLTSKRLSLQRRGSSAANTSRRLLSRFKDFARMFYPIKLDLGQMSADESMRFVDKIFREDIKHPALYQPIVAIMHTKDPINMNTIDTLLSYMTERGARAVTFKDVYNKLRKFNML